MTEEVLRGGRIRRVLLSLVETATSCCFGSIARHRRDSAAAYEGRRRKTRFDEQSEKVDFLLESDEPLRLAVHNRLEALQGLLRLARAALVTWATLLNMASSHEVKPADACSIPLELTVFAKRQVP